MASMTTRVLPDSKMEFCGVPSSIGGVLSRFASELLASIPEECTFTTELAKKCLLSSHDEFLLTQTIKELVSAELEILKTIQDTGFSREKLRECKGEYRVDAPFLESDVSFRGIPRLVIELKHDIDFRKVDIVQFHYPEMFPLVNVSGDD